MTQRLIQSNLDSDCIMLLDDSLSRLADIKELQIAMANADWNKQLPERRTQREQYYEGQERSSRAFLNLANSILDFLVNLTKGKLEFLILFRFAFTSSKLGFPNITMRGIFLFERFFSKFIDMLF